MRGGPLSDPTDLPLLPGRARLLRPTIACVDRRVDEVPADALTHQVTVHHNWRVTVPHDLGAERVATALGGHCSCLELVDRVIPAVRAIMPLLSRQELPAIEAIGSRGRWQIAPAAQASCCRGRQADGIGAAAGHVLGSTHLATQLDLPRWQVAWLLRIIDDAWHPAGMHLIDSKTGLTLWGIGVSPARRVALEAPGMPERFPHTASSGPLPWEWYASLVYRQVSVTWAFEVFAARPGYKTAEGIAALGHPERRSSAALTAEWLRIRADVPVESAAAWAAAGFTPAGVAGVAARTGWSIVETASQMHLWRTAGASPRPEVWEWIAGQDPPIAPPGEDDLARLTPLIEKWVPHRRGERPRVVAELHVMHVLLAANDAALERALRTGVRTVEGIAI